MTKFLDTYETWDKIFKLVKDNAKDYYRMYIHDNCWNSPEMSKLIIDKTELQGLIVFLQEFVDESN